VATHTTGITQGVKTLQVQIEEKLKKAAEKREAVLSEIK
jgi:hypothetical protein